MTDFSSRGGPPWTKSDVFWFVVGTIIVSLALFFWGFYGGSS